MSVTKNYIYNLIYQMLLIILPIITVPYITRILGTNGVGINTYTNSIIQYFMLFGSLGISLYANRQIAYVRKKRKELSKQFWSLFILKLITTTISYFVFIIYVCLTNSSYKIYLWIQSINILSCMLDISWLLMGLEEFKKTVMRNLIVKIISVILIFTLIKTKEDLWIYILIISLSSLISQAILWIYVPKFIDKCTIHFSDIKIHIAPSIKLFIPSVAIQIYSIFDKTYIGYICGTKEAGIYDMGEKIVYMSITIISSMSTVMLPRITNTLANGDLKKIKDYIVKSFNFSSYISIPMCLGLIGISNGLTLCFFGKEFMKSSYIMSIESLIIIVVSWANVTGVQLLIPFGKNNEYTLSVVVGAVIDVLSNVILVKYLSSIGAAISTVLAETIVTFIQIYMLRNILPLKEIFKEIWKYSISAIIMFIVIIITSKFLNCSLITTMFQIILGILVYFITQYLLKSEFQNYACEILKNKILLKK